MSGGNGKGGREALTWEGDPEIVAVARHLMRLTKEKFFGRVTIRIESGKIRIVQQEQTLKLDNLS